MTRRRLIASIAVSGTLAALAVLGIGRADAENLRPGPPIKGQFYPVCAHGGFTSTTVEGQRLTLEAEATPCPGPAGLPWEFVYEVRVYTAESRPTARRAFRSWTEPTKVILPPATLREEIKAFCVTYGGGVGRRLDCVRPIPPEPDGDEWTVAPLPTNDPILMVPDLDLLAPRLESPNPECGSCP